MWLDWSGELFNYYRMVKFYVRDGMIVDKIHEIISFKQSKWLEKILVSVFKNEINFKWIWKRLPQIT